MLPIDSLLPSVLSQLNLTHRLVVQAPPGAGKTTKIPLALMMAPWHQGKVLLIQPRRLAVYGAARRMAALLGEPVGQRVGYVTRYDKNISQATVIEVITEGVFLRRIQAQPDLPGVGLVILDEFHERSVTMDLSLALVLESQDALRETSEPLRVVVMSATLDGSALGAWLQAPVLRAEGQSFAVETKYKPCPVAVDLLQHTVTVILLALAQQDGDLLVFLPGMKEIRRVSQLLEAKSLGANVALFALHASLPQSEQDQALLPAGEGKRKVVLATNVAETSVTIDGIRVVIDCGKERVARFDESSGMDRLSTENITQASADQRRGRAGRTASGVCYRLWSETSQSQLAAFKEPEIVVADLAPVALELSLWGSSEITSYQLLTMPPADRYQRALDLVQNLGAVDDQGKITALGKKMARLGMSPRLARLLWSERDSDRVSAALASAAIVAEGDPLRFKNEEYQVDLQLRLTLWQSTLGPGEMQRGTWRRIQQFIRQCAQRLQVTWQQDYSDHPQLGQTLAQAFPDRVAQVRGNNSSRYLLANGKGATLGSHDRLAGTPYLVVLSLDGGGSNARIRLACAVKRADITAVLANRLDQQIVIEWHSQRQEVVAERRLQLGALVLESEPLPAPLPEAAQLCLLQQLKANKLQDLPWNEVSRQWLARLDWLHRMDPKRWPLQNLNTLIDQAEMWLLPYLQGRLSLAAMTQVPLLEALRSLLDWSLWEPMDRLAPTHWTLPTGTVKALDYSHDNGPVLRARLQEFYGLSQHPTLSDGTKILLELLSPAQRPIQLTRDLPGFWQGSYAEVAKEMRGRYPKHFWPPSPATAVPTTVTKRRMKPC